MKVENIGVTFGTNNRTIKKSKDQNYSYPAFRRNWAEHASWGANYLKKSGTTNFKLFSFPDAKAVFVEVAENAAVKLANIRDRFITVLGLAGAAAGASAAAGNIEAKPIDSKSRVFPMENKGDGVFQVDNVQAKPGDKYRYIIVTKDNQVNMVKDPYSKKQDNIHGWSTVYNPDGYKWKNTGWLEGKDPRRIVRKGNEPLRGLEKLIIDEVNIPTLTKEGTFESAKARIDEIARKGIATAIELMPIENTFSKQWGYDGVDKFAVNSNLGTPEQLKELIDHAHGKGLNVIIDMVPNHMGPDGDYLAQTGPYIKGPGEFGNLLNYEGKDNRYVRDWMTNAALWWATEFKVDGLRFDLTNKTGSDYLLRQIAVELNEHAPNVFLIAEDHEKKRHSITSYYKNPNADHAGELNFIDSSVDNITKGWLTYPWSIGFDSEWDSQYKDAVSRAALEPNRFTIDDLDKYIKTSHYRVKYAYSHDEIGNEDGTRFIPKYMSRHLGLFFNVNGLDDAEKGQNAAKAAQDLAELVVSKDFAKMSDEKLAEAERNYGIHRFISKQELTDVFKTAFAKQKIMLGTIMTTPGPKMFFQGDDEMDLSYFKFFRELSDDKAKRKDNPNLVKEEIKKKGYDTLEAVARPESTLGTVEPEGMFRDIDDQMIEFNADLRELLDKYPVLAKGEMIATYKDNYHMVHAHQLKLDGEELLIIKNFGQGFHSHTYNYAGFPKYGTWQEIFNSDAKEYGGSGYSNAKRNITHNNQNLSLAPNSFTILKKIK